MYGAFTPGAQRALNRAESLARARGGSAVEPMDLLAALTAEAESRAAELMVRFGLEPDRVLMALGLDAVVAIFEPSDEDVAEASLSAAGNAMPIAQSAALRGVLADANMQARAVERGSEIGTEHLLAALIAESSSAAHRLVAADLELERLRDYLAESLQAPSAPIPLIEEMPPLDLSDPTRVVDLGRIIDASANRAREGLRVAEDYVRFVLDDPGLTRRLKEVRHRLAAALQGFDQDLLIASRDTRDDVGTHIMTPSEQVRENPRAVLTANFKRMAEALRTLEEYGKLIDVWLAGRFEVLRYDVYTLEKLTLTAVPRLPCPG